MHEGGLQVVGEGLDGLAAVGLVVAPAGGDGDGIADDEAGTAGSEAGGGEFEGIVTFETGDDGPKT